MKIIKAVGVSKVFKLKKNKSGLEKFLSFLSFEKETQKFWALKNISFEAEPGENLGIIGKNGAGKSTLLRIISGIYKPDEGELNVNGVPIYISGFNHGLKPKLSMKDNIYLIASIMGLSKKETSNYFYEIIEFSELKNYLKIKLTKFSSGMIARLASSIGFFCLYHLKPDILLLDEAMEAGADIEFQNKFYSKMRSLINNKNITILFASHNQQKIKEICQKVIWLEMGKIRKIGSSSEVVEEYLNSAKK